MLTGRRPFDRSDRGSILVAIVHDEPNEALLPARVGPVVLRCLRKDPQGRFQTAAELRATIEELNLQITAPQSGRRPQAVRSQ
jgi:serine/threonine-protein kinase